MTGALSQADIARTYHFGNNQNGYLAAKTVTDNRSSKMHNSHAMLTENQKTLKRWLRKVLEDKEETQKAVAKLLGISEQTFNKSVSGDRPIKAHELLIVACYFDAELPILPGHGQARIAKRSNDNDADGINHSNPDEDQLWALAEKKVEEEEAKRGVYMTNEEYIDRIIKLYETLSRRKGEI
ncbi:helix-turn-helix domain-containing protein [Roseibium sediminicola]|uniref:Helix-turn-helix domain-containing protein n=1 Tax=Roseibium sediminicola TaxID=2933272 RepID=A0ABT0H0L1_9HYPH|nr:helix-turn-helix transcriptional regulator [Roseibium sp. CAU 1639]MCK7615216.1 helix-turn-helix domain-containing protein [Roseibium sp. CAU 1639]